MLSHRSIRFFLSLCTALVLTAVTAPWASATLSSQVVATGLHEPVSLTSPPDEENRLFTTDRTEGTINVIENGSTSVFLNLNAAGFPGVENSGFEHGILSMAFAPDYQTSRIFYVIYTKETSLEGGQADLQLDEFQTDQAGAAIPSSRRPVMTIDHSIGNQHYGGQLQFGPDGYLYISTGDGSDGSGNPAKYTQSQNLDTLLGKILRIDPSDPPGADSYSVPAGNPFVGVAGRDEIWSYGLRNPWRFSFDSATGDMLIGDVGETKAEEINRGIAVGGLQAGRGLNFGWPCREGFSSAYPTAFGCPLTSGYTDPIFTYGHVPFADDPSPTPESGCAVLGGYVVHDPSLGDVDGRYLYADLCTDQIRSFKLSDPAGTDRRETFIPNPPEPGWVGDSPESFGVDSCGRIYVAAGTIYRLTGSTPTICTPPEAPVAEACSGPFVAGKICGRLNPHTSEKVGYYFLVKPGSSCTGGTKLGESQANGENVAVSAEATGLSPGTQYSYCIVASNRNGQTTSQTLHFTTQKAPASISTQASASITVGAGSIHDTATLTGSSPTGTITFKAYGPNDATCASPAVFTSTVQVDNGNDDYESAGFSPSAPGTYRWTAKYSGDATNESADSLCNAQNESVVVKKVLASISTQASASITVGTGLIHDTATLTGANPTGTITFKVYGPNDATCSGPPIFTSSPEVTGNGDYESGGISPNQAGTYRWTAKYSGDTINESADSPCNSPGESVVITEVPPPAEEKTSSQQPPPGPTPVASNVSLKFLHWTGKGKDKKALLRATVAPCTAPDGRTLELRKGKRGLMQKQLDSHCQASFKLAIHGRVELQAFVPADSGHLSGSSNAVKFLPPRPAHH